MTTIQVPAGRKPAWKLLLLLGSLVAVAALFAVPRVMNSVHEKRLKSRITDYYRTFETANFDRLEEFINPRVERWFSEMDVELKDIRKALLEYRKKYPDAKSEVQWDTFTWKKDGAGNFVVEYELYYELRGKRSTGFKPYYLRVTSVWDKNLMLKSMYEERLG